MPTLGDEPPRQPSNRELLAAIKSVEFVLSELRDAVEERIRREEESNDPPCQHACVKGWMLVSREAFGWKGQERMEHWKPCPVHGMHLYNKPQESSSHPTAPISPGINQ